MPAATEPDGPAPVITSRLPNERGLTKNRLAEQIQLPAAQAKALAETLLAWFDLAGVLVEPSHPERLRHPRALRTTDLAEIAALLHAKNVRKLRNFTRYCI